MFGWLDRAWTAVEEAFRLKTDFRPDLEPGEVLIAQDFAGRVSFQGGFRWKPLALTSRRLIFFNPDWWLPFWGSLELKLTQIESVDKGNWFDWIAGGGWLRIRMQGGKDYLICPRRMENRDTRAIWIEAIRKQVELVHQETRAKQGGGDAGYGIPGGDQPGAA